jgi:hypothetical protein
MLQQQERFRHVPNTTHAYLEADLAMKKRALKRLREPASRRQRVMPSDALLAFLDGLCSQ